MVKFLDLKSQYYSIKDEIDNAIKNVIEESAFISSSYVKKFEEDFANYIGAKYCIGVGNGTDALEIAIEALNIPKGSEIIVPGNSFISTSEAVTRSGHHVVFSDVDPDTYTIGVDQIKALITSKTKAIIAVHLYGAPCNLVELSAFAKNNNLFLIEDCAQAHGAIYQNIQVGTGGDVSAFSFYPGKNLGAYGDAGAIVTNNESLAILCKRIANHGRIAKYDHIMEGRNSRLDGLQASILSVKLKHLEKWTNNRILIANYYLDRLKNIPQIKLPKIELGTKHVFHLFVISVEKRAELINFLAKSGVETGIHYPIALPKLEAYKYAGLSEADLFINKNDGKLLSLPIGDHITIDDAEFVCTKVEEFVKYL